MSTTAAVEPPDLRGGNTAYGHPCHNTTVSHEKGMFSVCKYGGVDTLSTHLTAWQRHGACLSARLGVEHQNVAAPGVAPTSGTPVPELLAITSERKGRVGAHPIARLSQIKRGNQLVQVGAAGRVRRQRETPTTQPTQRCHVAPQPHRFSLACHVDQVQVPVHSVGENRVGLAGNADDRTRASAPARIRVGRVSVVHARQTGFKTYASEWYNPFVEMDEYNPVRRSTYPTWYVRRKFKPLVNTASPHTTELDRKLSSPKPLYSHLSELLHLGCAQHSTATYPTALLISVMFLVAKSKR